MSLEVIAPNLRQLSVGGHSIEIAPLKVKQFPAVIRAAKPMLEAIAGDFDLVSLLSAYAETSDEVNKAISIVSGLSVEQIEEMHIDDVVSIISAMIEVNKDFFIRALPKAGGSGTGPTQ